MNLSKDICSEGGDLRAVSGPKIRAWSRHPRSGPPPPKKTRRLRTSKQQKRVGGTREAVTICPGPVFPGPFGYNLSRTHLATICPGPILVPFVPGPFRYSLYRAHFGTICPGPWCKFCWANFGTICPRHVCPGPFGYNLSRAHKHPGKHYNIKSLARSS